MNRAIEHKAELPKWEWFRSFESNAKIANKQTHKHLFYRLLYNRWPYTLDSESPLDEIGTMARVFFINITATDSMGNCIETIWYFASFSISFSRSFASYLSLSLSSLQHSFRCVFTWNTTRKPYHSVKKAHWCNLECGTMKAQWCARTFVPREIINSLSIHKDSWFSHTQHSTTQLTFISLFDCGILNGFSFLFVFTKSKTSINTIKNKELSWFLPKVQNESKTILCHWNNHFRCLFSFFHSKWMNGSKCRYYRCFSSTFIQVWAFNKFVVWLNEFSWWSKCHVGSENKLNLVFFRVGQVSENRSTKFNGFVSGKSIVDYS